jgi:hypothetical protein
VTAAALYGYGPFGPAAAAGWFLIATLNGGSAIALTSTIGFAQLVSVPQLFTRLAISATISANNVGYTLTPAPVTKS